MGNLVIKSQFNSELKNDFLAMHEIISKEKHITESFMQKIRNDYSKLFMQYRIKVEFRIAYAGENTIAFIPVNLTDELIINGILNS